VSNVFQGLLLTHPNQFPEAEKMIRLWIHESERTYGDRLVNNEHIQQYKSLMFDLAKKNFSRFNFNRYFQGANPENLIFCNFTNGIGSDRLYDQMPNDKLEIHVKDALKEYNDNNAYMGLVLFDDAMKHVCRITRIVLPPSGHALLVGVGGSGKQSLAKLASSIMGFTTFSITISSTYGINDLKEDLKQLYFKAGVKEEGFLFLFNEGQITNERFLVYINDLLSSGEIADLYGPDDKEPIINSVRPKVKADGRVDSRENCWGWFIEKVKQNLHMALCFSPVGESFRRRARQFPALVNCTVIDWFQPWPKDALLSVAESFLENIDVGEQQQVKQSIVNFMPFSFQVVNNLSQQILEKEKRYIYTTPKSFLELIQLYTRMLAQKKENLEKAKERYENGLIKLKETAEQVALIEQEVKVKQVEAEEKKKEADSFAETVGVEKAKVEAENEKANIEADKCSIIKKDVESQKSSTQADLDAAIPLVEQAKEALNSIKKDDFKTAKSWASPPAGIPEAFAASIFLLAGFFPEAIEIDKAKKPKAWDWKAALKMMKNPDEFLNKLKSYKDVVDANQVPAANVAIVKNTYLNMPDFTPEKMATKSGAAKGICEWVINIVKYYDVIQVIEPKRKALKEAIEQLEAATIRLNEVEEIVRKLNEDLAKLVYEYDTAIASKNSALAEAERYKKRLNLAQRLVSALGSENERWGKAIVDIGANIGLLPGDVLLAAAFISYAGPFNKKFRDIMINTNFLKFMKDQKIPMSSKINPVDILSDEATIALWNKEGLPSDAVSIENGSILTNSERYVLMVDPQLQGITWIKEKEKENKLRCLRLGTKELLRELEISIENGYSCLIENMDEKIDAILMPIIARSFIRRGKNKILKFGGKDLTLNEKFKLLLQTKLSNPHYPPEIHAETTMINFTVTEDGLGDQLLALVVGRERPDLAKMKVELIQQQNDFKIKLKELEDELLYKLANAQGDILDNISLIENLEDSKRISAEVTQKVIIAKATEAQINETSEFYRPAASRGALIYFLLTDLAKIHSFYKYSLESFIVVINRAIDLITEKKAVAEPEEKKEEAENLPRKSVANALERKKTEAEKEGNKDDEDNKKDEQGEGIEGDKENKDEANEGENEEKMENLDLKENDSLQIKAEEQLTPRSLSKRVGGLIESITLTSFLYTRRGLFERHKIIVSSMLCFRILLKDGKLDPDEVSHLILGKTDLNPPPMPDVLKNFLTEPIWASCKALEQITAFQQLSSSLETESLQWKKWYGEEKAEYADLPKAFKELSKFHRLLLLRAMRPDRLSSALARFIGEQMGQGYVEQQPFSMTETYAETNPTTPIFFVLFPGVDPTPDVERIGAAHGISISNGKFINISMGQGQEEGAKRAVFTAAKEGNWIMLQNIHLMQTWLIGINGLEGFLEQVYSTAHQNFRCFLSSEPPPLPFMNIIPESILQSSLKVANEAPQDLKANLRRAYAHFSQDFINDAGTKMNEFKAILFALCWYHSLVLGRKKFGSQGWSRVYNFNDGDLKICADVLQNYLAKYEQAR
jgi:dynein heavy chain, axonemal